MKRRTELMMGFQMAAQSYVRTTEGEYTDIRRDMTRHFSSLPVEMLVELDPADFAAAISCCVRDVNFADSMTGWNGEIAKTELGRMAKMGCLPIKVDDHQLGATLCKMVESDEGAALYLDVAIVLNDASCDGRFAGLFGSATGKTEQGANATTLQAQAAAVANAEREDAAPEDDDQADAREEQPAQPSPFDDEKAAAAVFAQLRHSDQREHAITLVRAHPRAALMALQANDEKLGMDHREAGDVLETIVSGMKDSDAAKILADGKKVIREKLKAYLSGREDLESAAAMLAPRKVISELLVEELGEGNTLSTLEHLRSWALKLKDREDFSKILDCESLNGRSLREMLVIALYVENGQEGEIPLGQYIDYGMDHEQGDQILSSLLDRRILPITLVEEVEEFADEKEPTDEELRAIAAEAAPASVPSPTSTASPASTPTHQAEPEPATENAAAASAAAKKLDDLL